MNLERMILEVLERVAPRSLTEHVLWSELRMDDGRTTLTDTRASLRSLESKGQVAMTKWEDTTRIKITSDGKLRLAE